MLILCPLSFVFCFVFALPPLPGCCMAHIEDAWHKDLLLVVSWLVILTILLPASLESHYNNLKGKISIRDSAGLTPKVRPGYHGY